MVGQIFQFKPTWVLDVSVFDSNKILMFNYTRNPQITSVEKPQLKIIIFNTINIVI